MTLAPTASSSEQTIAFAHALSRLLGWSYFLCWSISFYPQLVINFRRKKVTGLALDYFVTNVFGFACYSISALLFLVSPVVRREYAERHPQSPEPTVRWNDFAFAAHAFTISTITLSQFFLFSFTRHSSQRLSRTYTIILLLCLTLLFLTALLIPLNRTSWLDVVYTLQYIKLFLSLIKYLPQALLNFRRKSTVGWSIENILLDLSGGALSIIQLILDSSLQNDWSGVLGNPVKFFLGQISIVFDVLFLVQHYGLYRGAKGTGVEESAGGLASAESEEEEEGLLREEEGFGTFEEDGGALSRKTSRSEQEQERFGRTWEGGMDVTGARREEERKRMSEPLADTVASGAGRPREEGSNMG